MTSVLKESTDSVIHNWDKVATVALAAWGATLSTLLYFTDKPKLKLSVVRSFAVDITGSTEAIFCHVTNEGRRPIGIDLLQFQINNNYSNYFPLPHKYLKHDIPRRLNENESTKSILPFETLEDIADSYKIDITAVQILDNLGKKYRYKLKKKIYPELYKDKRNLLEKYRDRKANPLYIVKNSK